MDNKILIAYFMQKGKETSTSKRVADDIAAALKEKGVESTEFAITPVEIYPADKQEFEGVVKLEKEIRKRPGITSKVGHFDTYKTFVVVTPNWFNDVPMAVYRFFDEYDFGNKTIIPVVCHAGDGGAEVRESIRRYMPMADVYDGADVDDSQDDTKAVVEVVAEIVK